MKRKKIFIVVNYDWFFLSHRKNIALYAKGLGYDVTVVAKDNGYADEIRQLGVNYHNLIIDKAGSNIFNEIQTFYHLRRIYKKHRPELVHHVGLKTILWGSFAAMAYNIPVINAISGLGVVFSDRNKKLTAKILLTLLRVANYKLKAYAIFQNLDDKRLFIKNKIVSNDRNILIPGSGVDLDELSFEPEIPSERLSVVFIARMIKEKGVLDLIKAAELLREEYYSKIQFILCGKIDENPNSIKLDYLEKVCDGDYIKYSGYIEDVKTLLISSSIVVHPSYYREGVPKSLIEAAAVGRPIITTSSVGCKDVVIEGYNGFKVSPKSPISLAQKIEKLAVDKALRESMGINSRKYAEKKFSVKKVEKMHSDLYSYILNA